MVKQFCQCILCLCDVAEINNSELCSGEESSERQRFFVEFQCACKGTS